MMRILYICKTFNPKIGGGEKHAYRLAHIMEERGHEVVRLSYDSEDGSEYTIVPPKRTKIGKEVTKIFYDKLVVKQIVKSIREIKPDIIHHQHKDPCSTSMGRALQKIKREMDVPVVATVHGFGPLGCITGIHVKPDGTPCDGIRKFACFNCINSFKGKLVIPLISLKQERAYRSLFAEAADVLTTPSLYLKKALEQKGYTNIVHLFYFVRNIEPDPSYSFEPGTILFVGRLHPTKGVDDLIRAMPYVLMKVDAKLVIAGTGPQRSELEQLAKKLNIGDHVIFKGFIEGESLKRAYRTANVVVAPSTWVEIFGQVILEAMLFARPVVATRRGGIPELVEDGVTGYLVAPKNAKELANRIIDVVQDQELATNMGKAGYDKVKKDYSPDKYADRLEVLYSKIS